MHESGFGRVIGALISPEKTFRSIAERPTWVVPLVVFVLVMALVTALTFQKIDFAEVVQQQMAAQGREAPPEAEGASGFMKGCFGVAFVVGPILMVLIFAGVYMIFNLFGGQLRYKTSLSVVLYASMPGLVKALLTLPVVFSRKEISMEELQRGQVLKSSLAFLAPEDAGPRLLVLLSSIDFFTLWSVVLTIIGFHIAARVSKTTAAAVSIAVWLLLILFGVVMAGFAPQGG